MISYEQSEVQDSGWRIEDRGFRIHDLGFRIEDAEYRIQDSGFIRVLDLGFSQRDSA